MVTNGNKNGKVAPDKETIDKENAKEPREGCMNGILREDRFKKRD